MGKIRSIWDKGLVYIRMICDVCVWLWMVLLVGLKAVEEV